jgi:LytS/YehU family sensor histidine kinase
MLRYSLTKNNINKIALTEELEMVDNYVALSKIQLEERLKFTKEVATKILKIEIPPMLIQILIENAIKHGISNLPNGGKVTLKINKKATDLIIEVRNTGELVYTVENTKTDAEINSALKKSTKLGLENIKKRLALIYGKKAKFTLNEIENEVVARIVLPL